MPPPPRPRAAGLLAGSERRAALRAMALDLPSLALDARQSDELALLLAGDLHPLGGFMTEAEHRAVLAGGRLPDGSRYALPVTLSHAGATAVEDGSHVALRDQEGTLLAVMTVTSSFTPDRRAAARRLLGTDDAAVPGVRRLLERDGQRCLGGPLEGVALPAHEDFEAWRQPPPAAGRRLVVPADGPLHRQQLEQGEAAASALGAAVLVLVTAGPAPHGEPDVAARVRSLLAWQRRLAAESALTIVPLSPWWAGEREALHLARLARNLGGTHLMLGGDLGVPRTPTGTSLQPDAAAWSRIVEGTREIGIEALGCPRWAYRLEHAAFAEAAPGDDAARWGNRRLRAALERGAEPPTWFSFPEVLAPLRELWPPRSRLGIVLLFTGLSGSGKSTLARRLHARLVERGPRRVTLLDGDDVRRHLSSELGFSREHRDLNVRRIGFVAAEIARHGGTVICAPIAPYAATRRWIREQVEAHAAFVEVHLATPLAVCEARDPKGLYARARRGEIAGFTGIDDPYEPPSAPELSLDTGELTDAAVDRVLEHLASSGLIERR